MKHFQNHHNILSLYPSAFIYINISLCQVYLPLLLILHPSTVSSSILISPKIGAPTSMKMKHLLFSMGNKMINFLMKRNQRKKPSSDITSSYHNLPYIKPLHVSGPSNPLRYFPSTTPSSNFVVSNGHTDSSHVTAFAIPQDTYPNALHVISVNIVSEPVDDFDGVRDETVNSIIDEDSYGAPLAPLKQNFQRPLTPLVSEENGDIAKDITDNTHVTETVNNDVANPNVNQEPSSLVPDQNNPDKYVNTDQETLKKIINNQLFYNDIKEKELQTS